MNKRTSNFVYGTVASHCDYGIDAPRSRSFCKLCRVSGILGVLDREIIFVSVNIFLNNLQDSFLFLHT